MENYHRTPFAERVRPSKVEEFTGQKHLLGEGAVLQKALTNGSIPSMILWGPPGVGKTTLAYLLAKSLDYGFFAISAIQSGVKDVRDVIEKAKKQNKCVLFIDEIHRFSKSQQDALLGAVEKGIIILIGATTENPSFEVISALLSRCQVYVLNPLSDDELIQILHKAIRCDSEFKHKEIVLTEMEALLHFASGDARKLLNAFELFASQHNGNKIVVTNKEVLSILQKKMALFDKNGEQHYDVISAFIKSMRGSDPNGAVYWLSRMIEGGEDPKFIARRMVILASEDIGNANPNALVLATSTFQAVTMIGMPESRIILSQCAIYLASSPKSNASYMAIENALSYVKKSGDLTVPLHLRNAPTKLMKNLDYGKNYSYAHSFENNFSEQEYLPDKAVGLTFYKPGNNQKENEIRRFLKERWKEKYEY